MSWDVSSVPSLVGKVVVITGCTSGVGEWALHYVFAKGATCVMAVRNVKKAEQVKSRIEAEVDSKDGKIEVLKIDTSDLESVKAFAKAFNQKYDRLDILLNNAGIAAVPQEKSRQGFDLQFATNHLGHFLLVGLLLERLLGTQGARVVNVSSPAHRHLKDVDYTLATGKTAAKAYGSGMGAYASSKLANMLFTLELAKRLRGAGSDVLAVSAQPGFARTDIKYKTQLYRGATRLLFEYILEPLLSHDADHGSWPLLMAMTDPEAKPGNYYSIKGFLELAGPPALREPASQALDEEKARILWEFSENAVGHKYL